MLSELGLAKVHEEQSREMLQKSEKKYRKLFENINEGFALHEIIVDENKQAVDYRYLDVNPEFERMTGLNAKKIVGRKASEVLSGIQNEPGYWIKRYGEVALEGKNITFEDYSKVLNKWFHVNSFSPQSGQFAVTFTDITERKRAVNRLKESESKFRALIEQSLTGIYIFNQDRFLYVNQKFCDIFGYTREEILNKLKPTDVVEKNERQQALENINRRLIGEVNSVHYFAKGKRKDKRELWIEIHGSHIELDGEHVITGTVLDITTQHQNSIKIEESELKFRSIFEQAAVGVSIIETATGKYYEVNQKQCEIVGYNIEEFLQLDFMEITHPDDLNEDLVQMERLKNGEIDMFVIEKRYFHKDGSLVWVNLHVARLWLQGEYPKYHVAICEDITQRKRAEQAIINSEKRFKGVVEQSLTGICIFNNEKFVYTNKRFAEIFGYDEAELLESVRPIDVVAKEERLNLQERFQKGHNHDSAYVSYVAKGIRKDKSSLWIEIHGGRVEVEGKVFISGMVLDVTDKIQAENSLKRQNAYLALLKEVDVLVMQSKSLNEFTRFVLLKLFEIIECDNAVIKEFIGETSSFKTVNANLSIELSSLILENSYKPFSYEKFKKGHYLLGNNCTQHLVHIQEIELISCKGIRSTLTVPLVIQNKLYGVLELMSSQHNYFSEENISFIQTLAQHLSIGINKVLTDIELYEHTKRLEEAQRIGKIGSWEYNIESGKGIWSKELYNITGLSEKNINLGYQEFLNLVVPSDKEFVKNKILDAQSSRSPQSFEFQIRYKNKKNRVINAYVEAHFNALGKLKRLLGLIQDVTENKQMQAEIKERNAIYKMLFDTAPDGIIIANKNGNLLDSNPAMCSMLRYSKKEIVSLCASDIVSTLEYSNIKAALEYITSQPDYYCEWIFKRKDGTQFSAEVIANQLADGSIMAMVRDMTERKIAEDEIKNLNVELESRVQKRTAELELLNNELRAFTYSVSHDLKAPLRGINGYSKLLLDLYAKSLNDEAKSFIENICSGTDQMNKLIDDLLNYSRLERSEINMVPFNLSDVIQDVLHLSKSELVQNNIKVKIDIKQITVISDRNALTIALRNVIENAIKFTRSRSDPYIHIYHEQTNDKHILIVKDNGIGFDMIFHDKIFNIFQRLHRVEDYEGTGIGLAIVKKAMTRLGGDVWAESSENNGAIFYLQIPKFK
ncbi:PAS domain S-box protein [Plebeiibacterium sediminum]|uniref:histidine kinase n=1 Tax=Plebeiibacterium sediminum TaxID=2992112 RepID=A0AAE3SFI9_9BACT|nr:PAS domain S-box protein [Plebeiobacterium sediminum]MCW3787483.1 PAS domain S-box protein [Plebeiobacterium sediminum]